MARKAKPSEPLVVRALYLKIVALDGSERYEERLTWDAERLYQSLDEQYEKEGLLVRAVTREEYDAQRFAKGPRR